MRRPALSSSGPPELPGLMAASVWITSRMGRLVTERISRPRALITPVVSVWSRPKGLPMANTFWPTLRSRERADRERRAACPPARRSCSTARSWSGARPTGCAFQVDWSESVHLGPARALDHVEVGDDVPALVPHEAGAGALRDLHDVQAEEVAAHAHVRDVHDGGRGLLEEGRPWPPRRRPGPPGRRWPGPRPWAGWARSAGRPPRPRGRLPGGPGRAGPPRARRSDAGGTEGGSRTAADTNPCPILA